MKKYILYLALILGCFFSLGFNVHAEVKFGGTTMSSSNYVVLYEGNRTITFSDEIVYSTLSDFPQYYLITACSDTNNIISWYVNNNSLSSVNIYNTNYKCMFPNSDYTGGHIVYIYGSYNVSTSCSVNGTTCAHNGSLTMYVPNQSSWSLLSYQNSKEEISIDYSSNTIISQNDEIISKQNELITKQNETNSKLDEANETSKGILDTIKGVFTAIGELPSKLVNLLIDALKSLFVPTDEQLYEIINEASELSENFGFVGESVSFFINIFTSLLGLVNANGCVELPEFTIGSTSLFDNHTFWEAQQVCLADNTILSSNIDVIRIITSIVLVCLFINFAASKFFSILSKNESVDTTIDVGDIRSGY